MQAIKVKNVTLGSGRPKIAVPITGKELPAVLTQAAGINATNADLVEWRLDCFAPVTDFDQVDAAATQLRQRLADLPLLLTFRTHAEGGQQPAKDEFYFQLLHHLVKKSLGDLLDVELFHDSEQIRQVITAAQHQQIKVVMSNHDFTKTPAITEIQRRLKLMATLGADIAKIAVMPHSAQDVLKLLWATNAMKDQLNCPLITMAMGDLGKVTRISGEVFGSCLTFGTVGAASAPGQIQSQKLRQYLAALQLSSNA